MIVFLFNICKDFTSKKIFGDVQSNISLNRGRCDVYSLQHVGLFILLQWASSVGHEVQQIAVHIYRKSIHELNMYGKCGGHSTEGRAAKKEN